MLVWIRTCQECGRITTRFAKPTAGMTDAYANATCRACKSPALDYGSYVDAAKDLEGNQHA
jgi:hypothetical protein